MPWWLKSLECLATLLQQPAHDMSSCVSTLAAPREVSRGQHGMRQKWVGVDRTHVAETGYIRMACLGVQYSKPPDASLESCPGVYFFLTQCILCRLGSETGGSWGRSRQGI